MGGERRGKRELTLVFFVLFPVLVLMMVGGCGSKEWGGGGGGGGKVFIWRGTCNAFSALYFFLLQTETWGWETNGIVIDQQLPFVSDV